MVIDQKSVVRSAIHSEEVLAVHAILMIVIIGPDRLCR